MIDREVMVALEITNQFIQTKIENFQKSCNQSTERQINIKNLMEARGKVQEAITCVLKGDSVV